MTYDIYAIRYRLGYRRLDYIVVYTEYGISSSVLALSLKLSNAGPGP